MKIFSAFEKRAILNVAKSVNPLNRKIATIDSKIEDLQKEKELLEQQIDNMEATITPFTDNYKSSDLVVSFSKNNVTGYSFKYPDTILPPDNNDNNNLMDL